MKKRMYIRTSSLKQNTDRQHEIAKNYIPDVIYEEKISGVSKNRPQLDLMISECKSGDTVIVESWSRLARSMKDLISIVDTLKEKNVELISDKEQIDTSTPTGQLMFHIMAALSQFERDILIQRTQEGLAASKNKGGRPNVDKTKIDTALDLHALNKYSVNQICKQSGISRATFYREKEKRENIV